MKCSLGISSFLEENSSLSDSIVKAFLSLLAIHCNSEFRWVYLSFFPLPLASLLFSATCEAFSDNHFAFLHFFFLRMVLITTSYSMSQTSVYSSSGILSSRSNPLNLFVTRPCTHQEPGEKRCVLTRDWIRLAYECPGASGRGVGWQFGLRLNNREGTHSPPIDRKLDYRFIDHGPERQKKTQFSPQ